MFRLLLLLTLPLLAFAQKPLVGTTTFALYDIVKNVAKDSVELYNIVPFGTSIHTYEPTPKDATKIAKSSIVFYSGASLEPWIKGFSFAKKSLDLSSVVDLITLEEEDHHDHHHHGSYDPHYWLDASNMIKVCEAITKELGEIVPEKKEYFIVNALLYIDELKRLDAEFRSALSECKQSTIIVNHDAFSYLAKRYGFRSLPLSSLAPESEPSAKRMIAILKHIRSSGSKVIFAENFASQKAMQSIADEAGVELDLLQPLGNITADEAKADLSYVQIMRQNIAKISKALQCR